jgi:subtilisin family serine protease
MICKTFILLALVSVLVFPQDKYLIYFKDKLFKPEQLLSKSDDIYKKAVSELSDRAIERRLKNMGDNFITYEDLPLNQDYIASLSAIGVVIIYQLKWFNAVSARLTLSQIEQLKSLDFIDRVEPVKSFAFNNSIIEDNTFLKNDTPTEYGPSFKQLDLSDIPIVHSKGITGDNVIVGLLDSGFDWERHISLQSRNVLDEYDFIFNDNNTANEPEDNPSQHDHGTLIFSIIGGYDDSTLIGTAYNSTFLLAKTEDIRSERRIEEDNFAAALIWMEGLGVDITSSSLGYSLFDLPGESYTYSDMDGNSTIVTRAAELAFLRGVSTFTSAGNEGNTPWFYITAPADGKNTIAVGAVNSLNEVASFSSRGPTSDGRIKPDVVAMGVAVYGASAGTSSNYRFANGTSTSAPIASGVAALLLSVHSHLKNTQIRSILLESADNSLNPNNEIGYGLISAAKAIEFPNLEFINNSYVLRKIFFKENINYSSVRMHYSVDGENFIESSPIFDRNFRYTFNIPQFQDGQNIEFYFSLEDSLGVDFRIPELKNYNFNYGSLEISLNLPLPVDQIDYKISNPFPNPFIPAEHQSVRINYKSSGNEIFKMTIIDGSGQRVKHFNEISSSGINFVEWNGYSDNGYLCSSGVYFMLIQFNGKEFGKKLVLLK